MLNKSREKYDGLKAWQAEVGTGQSRRMRETSLEASSQARCVRHGPRKATVPEERVVLIEPLGFVLVRRVVLHHRLGQAEAVHHKFTTLDWIVDEALVERNRVNLERTHQAVAVSLGVPMLILTLPVTPDVQSHPRHWRAIGRRIEDFEVRQVPEALELLANPVDVAVGEAALHERVHVLQSQELRASHLDVRQRLLETGRWGFVCACSRWGDSATTEHA